MASDLEHVSGPDAEPVTLAEAKAFCRVYGDVTDDDAFITTLIVAARDFIERRNGRAFGVQTWRERRAIPATGVVRLYKAPVVEVLSVEVDGESKAGEVRPGNRLRLDGSAGGEVVVEYRAGWETIPATARLALLALVVHWYDRREPVITGTIVATVPMHFEALEASLSWGAEVPRR